MVFRIIRPNAESVWQDKNILARFPYYKNIIDGNQIARYLVAKSLECVFSPQDSISDLEQLLNDKSKEFKNLVLLEFSDLKNREIVANSYLKLAETIAIKYLEDCIFCERQCKVNRIDGEKGYCLLTKDSYVSSAFLHMGEESVLIPSGTIFFQSCNFGCVFCQNYDISQAWKKVKAIEDVARKVKEKELAILAEKLAERGAININYVGGDPIPNIHTILGSLTYQKTNICQLWNSNFYLTEQSLSLIIDFMDFWLPDFKYGNNKCGEKYSGIKNYYVIITRNLKKIHDEGSGEIIIRHLVMPNHIECCSKPILDFVAKEVPKCVVNIMGQYRPEYKANQFHEINRRPTSQEMQEVRNYADKLGILWKPVS
ncbi:MAG: radical SAM protein [Candidatus Hermodarchaeota archaeon]